MGKKFRGKKRFYVSCIAYVKKRQDGYIHPKDTSYPRLVRKLEALAGITDADPTGNPITRCLRAARVLGIALPKHDSGLTPTEARKLFYRSQAWKKLRYNTIKRYGARCQCCGTSGDQAPIRVDHIKPISKYWHLRLDPENMQVLCNDCNWGKSNVDETDWRVKPKRIRLRLVASN